jgi:hypothetical protein
MQYRPFKRDCDHVITVSEQQRRTLLRKGFAPDRVSVVRPGIPYLVTKGEGRMMVSSLRPSSQGSAGACPRMRS